MAEPSIQQQGDNRILVQLPGVQDPERAKALIGKTALLEFKLVDERADAGPRGRARARPRATRSSTSGGSTSRRGRRGGSRSWSRRRRVLTGADLATARVSIDQNTSEPYVSVEFNAAGAKRLRAS